MFKKVVGVGFLCASALAFAGEIDSVVSYVATTGQSMSAEVNGRVVQVSRIGVSPNGCTTVNASSGRRNDTYQSCSGQVSRYEGSDEVGDVAPSWDSNNRSSRRLLDQAVQQALHSGRGVAMDGGYLIEAVAMRTPMDRQGCAHLVVTVSFNGMLSDRSERQVCGR